MLKYLLIFLVGAPALAMDAAPPMAKPFDLLKCKSAKHGTVWASFGRVMTSKKPEPTFFVTEVAVFSPDQVWRVEYGTDFKRALSEVETRVTPASGSLHFAVEGGRRHSLTWVQYDRRDPNSFLGNWRVQEGSVEVNDALGCTLL